MQQKVPIVQARCLKSFRLDGKTVHRGDRISITRQIFRVFSSAGLVEDAPVFQVSEAESPKKSVTR